MFGSAVCEVALGLMVTYGSFGVLCSGAREFFARSLSEREEMLAMVIYRLLGTEPPADRPARSATEKPVHPWSTGAAAADPAKQAATLAQRNIAALVLGHPLIRNMGRSASDPPSYIPAQTFAHALIDILSAGGAERSVEEIRHAVLSLEAEGVRGALLPLIDAAGSDLEKLRTFLERRFDHVMDRATGWYKRNSQRFIFALGVVVAVAANCDTFHVVKALWHDPTRRAQLATATADPGRLSELLPLPVGWHDLPHDTAGWALKFLGWLLTAAAITLGAPFWFEMLSQFVNLRSAGPQPARTGDV
jgi:hypothetical protein